jgi:hypothetical protein
MDNIYTKTEVSTLLENYATIADISANEYVIANALIDLHDNKADKSTTYTKAEIDSLLENIEVSIGINSSTGSGGSVDPNDLSIYELKSDLANDLSIYVLNSSLIDVEEVIASAITELGESVDELTNNVYTKSEVDSLLLDVSGSINSNDLSIYELKSDLANDLSIYELKSDLVEDLSIYVLNSSLIEVEEVIASAISNLNSYKADASITYSKSEVDTLIQAVSATPGKSAYQSYVDTTLDDPIKSEAEWVASISGGNITLDTYVTYATLNSSLNNYALNNSLFEVSTAISNKADKSTTYTKTEVDNLLQNAGSVNPNDLSIYELKSDLINDLSIYQLKEDLTNDLSIYALSNTVYTKTEVDNLIANCSSGESTGGSSSINSSILDDYVLKTYIGTLPNRVEPIYYTAEEIAAAEEGDAAYGKTTSDIKTPGTQYNNMVEAIEEGEEVAAAAIVDINNKINDISTRVSNIANIAAGPSIWIGT